ncbi:MAG: LL-diaminopimelate aminotransferase [Thermoanaerobacteraceae bacterium]|uniref:LL-diaminopimelate aminotransferase n=1 Tax=Thermanaeromonas sp. C210 TaxID=2731925 RepID=UPI00155C28FB|nr:LL-diaminopimelate aminotransferase [Thermanaeromonas sp. C210]MBE3581013.1 LL-diaminopimelate aminotransferase [Thermoanaerobacteraceae bacterium]GFN24034.1 LL-diaminopimelate aminotransferase [Thermanaeromonas sp. C210]
MEQAQRIQKLPPYLFARIEKKIEEARERGVDIISLGIGDPDMPTPSHVIAKLKEEAQNPENHRYPTSVGLLSFRQAIAGWYRERYGVELDPRSEVVTLIGSKEGIAHISFCYVDPGDVNLVPDPGYPVYGIGTLLAGGEPYLMPLKEERGYLPDLAAIPSEVARRAKLMFLNYPNNPTGAVVRDKFFHEVVEFAKSYDIIVCHDAAYSEITYDGYRAPSFLATPGAKDVGIEFNSLSKPYNMTGWRLGWACGRADVIEALGRLKSNIDSGVFQAVQYAGIEALTGPQDGLREVCRVYQERRDLVVDGLNSMGWRLSKPLGTFYVWAPVPAGYTSESFAETVLEKAGVIVTPGNGYGRHGEGYFRIALTIDKERIKEAFVRLRRALGQVRFD